MANLAFDSVIRKDVEQLVEHFKPWQIAEDAVAAVRPRREAAETESLFALDVRQHEREVLPDMVHRQAVYAEREAEPGHCLEGFLFFVVHGELPHHLRACALSSLKGDF